MVVVVDPQIAGVSGDMMLSCLVDMGADQNVVIDSIRRSEKFFPDCPITKIGFEKIQKHGVQSTRLILEIGNDGDGNNNNNSGHDHHGQDGGKVHQRMGSDIKKAITDAAIEVGLSAQASAFAESCINHLLYSESRIHGVPVESVHFHEASGIDTLVDIIGVAAAMDNLKLFEETFVCLPVAVGSGSVTFSHGTMSNPAGAILEIFKGSKLAIRGNPVSDELATPTGACILRSITTESMPYYPSMRITSVGYGAGQKDFEAFANVLKIVKGDKYPIRSSIGDGIGSDHIKILETNVDDVSGEVLGGLIEKLMARGAKDASIYSGFGKKSRLTNLVCVLCSEELVYEMIEVLVHETGTLGIRISESERFVVHRSVHSTVLTVGDYGDFEVHYKRSNFGDEYYLKIEFDDLSKISVATGKPIRIVEQMLRKDLEVLEESGNKEYGRGGSDTGKP